MAAAELVDLQMERGIDVVALDKAETIIQHNQGANPADFDYAFNLTYGSGYFRDDDLLRDLRRLLDDETRRHIVP